MTPPGARRGKVRFGAGHGRGVALPWVVFARVCPSNRSAGSLAGTGAWSSTGPHPNRARSHMRPTATHPPTTTRQRNGAPSRNAFDGSRRAGSLLARAPADRHDPFTPATTMTPRLPFAGRNVMGAITTEDAIAPVEPDSAPGGRSPVTPRRQWLGVILATPPWRPGTGPGAGRPPFRRSECGHFGTRPGRAGRPSSGFRDCSSTSRGTSVALRTRGRTRAAGGRPGVTTPSHVLVHVGGQEGAPGTRAHRRPVHRRRQGGSRPSRGEKEASLPRPPVCWGRFRSLEMPAHAVHRWGNTADATARRGSG